MNGKADFVYDHVLGKHGLSLSFDDGGDVPGAFASPCARAFPNGGACPFQSLGNILDLIALDRDYGGLIPVGYY